MEYFGALEDPRIERCKRHQLLDIITIAICAVICGADSWVYVEVWQEQGGMVPLLPGPAQRHPVPRHLRRRVLPLGCGPVPRVFPKSVSQECFMEWSQPVVGLLPGEVVAIDGKTVRRSHDKRAGKQAIHLVSSWAAPELAEGQHTDPGTGED